MGKHSERIIAAGALELAFAALATHLTNEKLLNEALTLLSLTKTVGAR